MLCNSTAWLRAVLQSLYLSDEVFFWVHILSWVSWERTWWLFWVLTWCVYVHGGFTDSPEDFTDFTWDPWTQARGARRLRPRSLSFSHCSPCSRYVPRSRSSRCSRRKDKRSLICEEPRARKYIVSKAVSCLHGKPLRCEKLWEKIIRGKRHY